eukprot:TRINITY_DN14211_c0_g1_i1.p1 TRINITY_DN14211_c0_g1~~TRINITY_DN14211_c0_g1_i1.p1  ORF type:complete len:608 (-),score=177.06 TRINITY_DN14211_c0_g1_i1:79-1902(-)
MKYIRHLVVGLVIFAAAAYYFYVARTVEVIPGDLKSALEDAKTENARLSRLLHRQFDGLDELPPWSNPPTSKRRRSQSPELCVALLTDRRYDTAEFTAAAVAKHLREYEPGVPYELVLVEVGHHSDATDFLLEHVIRRMQVDKFAVSPIGLGFGSEVQMAAFGMCRSPFVLLLKDDWDWAKGNAGLPYFGRDDPQVRKAMRVVDQDPTVLGVYLHPTADDMSRTDAAIRETPETVPYRAIRPPASGRWSLRVNGGIVMSRTLMMSVAASRDGLISDADGLLDAESVSNLTMAVLCCREGDCACCENGVCRKGPDTIPANEGSVPVGYDPKRPAYSAHTKHVYVPCQANNSVYIIDPTDTNSVRSVGPTAQAHVAVYVASLKRVYIFAEDANHGWYFDDNEELVAFSFASECTQYDDAVFNPVNGRIYLGCRPDHTVGLFDPSSNTQLGSASVGNTPIGLGVHPSQGTVYVANYGSGTVSAIHPRSNEVKHVIGGLTRPHGVVYSASNDRLYVICNGGMGIFAYDPNTYTRLGFIDSGGHNGAVHPLKGDLYVNDYMAGRVQVISATTFNVTMSIAAGPNAFGIAFADHNKRLYVTNGSPTVNVVAPP